MNQNCKYCKSPIEKDGLCNRHYYRALWLDNRDVNNLGIEKFANAIVPHWARQETAQFQREVYYAFFQLYSSSKKDKIDRQIYELAFRGAAKTTRAKIIILYCCCYGLEKFIIYCANTNTFAVNDITDVKNELSQNLKIRYYFGVINSKKVQGMDGEWSRDAYKTSTGVYVLARGVGQAIRSALKGSYRPTLAIINDMYQKDDVKTEYTREEFKKWFYNDMLNAIDDLEGKIFFNGTILHQDTVPNELRSNKSWIGHEYPAMDVDDFHEVISKYCKREENDLLLPNDEVMRKISAEYKVAWEGRLSLELILRKYRESILDMREDEFYQEYFHIVVTPEGKPIRDELIKEVPMDLFKSHGYTWLRVKFGEDNQVIYPVRVFLGLDPASSTNLHAKYSVHIVICMNHLRQVFVYRYSRGHFALRDDYVEGISHSDGDAVILDRSLIKRKGIVDEEIRMARECYVEAAQIETTQAQQHIYTEVQRIMGKNNAYHILFKENPMVDKAERDATLITPYFQTGNLYLNIGMDELKQELKSFPKGQTVDIIDALYHALKIASPASKVSYKDAKKNRLDEVEELDETDSFQTIF